MKCQPIEKKRQKPTFQLRHLTLSNQETWVLKHRKPTFYPCTMWLDHRLAAAPKATQVLPGRGEPTTGELNGDLWKKPEENAGFHEVLWWFTRIFMGFYPLSTFF